MGKRRRRRSDDIRRKIKRLKRSLDRRHQYSEDEVSEYDSAEETYPSDYEAVSEASASDYSNTEELKSVIVPVETLDPNSAPALPTESPPTSGSAADPSTSIPEAPPVTLPDNILEALGGTKEKEEKFGPNVPDEIAKRWGRITVEGLGKEEKEELTEKFLVPENFKLLKAPKLNAEIATVMSESSRQRDKRMEKSQNQLGLAIAGLSKLTGSLISENLDKLAIIKQIADVSQLLADLHSENTNSRRKIILPSLDKKFTSMMQDVKRDSYLFGENLGEKIKASKSAEKSGLQIKRSYTSNPPPTSKKYTPRQGNWRAPPRQQGSRANKPGGYRDRDRTRAPQHPRRTTSDKYQQSSYKRDNRQQRKHH
ncbi:uncharacterized protein LOC125226992 [Leguminivora glycinivorella]|uniref:uncharacterized protein LOC125226992 n=1 Tax=Leguminivora glycinivorella TaxID=1035111 RepID=UPI00200D49E0|nr:uncharacterized protein LOC125226992 [Leguminivora glycinivorella]